MLTTFRKMSETGWLKQAADRSQSLEEFLLQELERIAATPSVASLVEAIQRRQEASDTSLATSEMPCERDDDRT